jgi:hypothetical protein
MFVCASQYQNIGRKQLKNTETEKRKLKFSRPSNVNTEQDEIDVGKTKIPLGIVNDETSNSGTWVRMKQ